MIGQIVDVKTKLAGFSSIGQIEFLSQLSVIRDRINRLGGPNRDIMNFIIGRSGLNFEDFEGKLKIGTLNAGVKRDFRVVEMINAMNTVLDAVDGGAFGGVAPVIVLRAASREEVMAEIRKAEILLGQKNFSEAFKQAAFAQKLAASNNYLDLSQQAGILLNQIEKLSPSFPIIPVVIGGVALLGLLIYLMTGRKGGMGMSGLGVTTRAVRRGECPADKPIAVYEILGTRLPRPICRSIPGIRRIGTPRKARRIKPEMLGLDYI